tara:strand:+ start:690 stop:1328 length:639 start_codon:yes stop_codon:yes gene_type:complete
MNLFLDTVSPIPKFSIIKDNKIKSIQILDRNSNKISDNIAQVFIKIQRKFILNNKIDNLVICTGPGSYTALRLGIAFMYGISISRKIPLIGISGIDLLKLAVPKQYHKQTLYFINSANEQNFFCSYSSKNNKYSLNKISHDSKKDFDNNKFIYSISNSKLDSFIIKSFDLQKYKIVSFNEIVKLYIENILLKKKNISIEPIYIQDKSNKIFC